MAFEKTMQAVEQREESGVESAEEQELKQEEETSDDDVQSSNETQEIVEEQVDWKARAEKAEQERDNYKQGLLNEKAGKRQLTQPVKKVVEPEENEDVQVEEDRSVNVSDDRIRSVIYQDNEKRALRTVVDPKSSLYLPELVDDSQYNEVISYLPHAIDKSSVESIHRALRVAIKAWKYDRGIEDDTKSNNSSVKASIAAVKSTNAAASLQAKQSGGRHILKSQKGMKDWY